MFFDFMVFKINKIKSYFSIACLIFGYAIFIISIFGTIGAGIALYYAAFAVQRTIEMQNIFMFVSGFFLSTGVFGAFCLYKSLKRNRD